MKWYKLADKLPKQEQECLISNGKRTFLMTARIGITPEQRQQMKDGLLPDPTVTMLSTFGEHHYKRSDMHQSEDYLTPPVMFESGPYAMPSTEIIAWAPAPQYKPTPTKIVRQLL